MNVADPLTLLGTWQLDRVIDDRRNNVRGTATGRLTLAPEPAGDRLRWFEECLLEWRDYRGPATRTYYLAPGPDGWRLTFDDGRLFHRWRPGETVRHDCGDDDYAGTVEPAPETGGMIIVWRVTGPRKDYTSTTRLTFTRPYGADATAEAT
ncbi:DUF6314 family protein [Microlunatus parietis]|uniref:DUF6314 domain-containing protein n=1 Tax=Microlunatus parietis TaxID=682979 RepID=A0A7Y9I3N6_9ACTN|nr:DUF6314 family protein [Microlunatus parietis]NYE69411.1 hypothetical protein [Microlunatus parietis]